MGDGYGVTREFDLEEFCRCFHHYPVRAYNALGLLSRSGYIEWTDAEENHSRVMMIAGRDDLYGIPLPPLADRVLNHILRSCTGIFSEYATIDEGEIGNALRITENEVSEQLVNLSRRHIIKFIPRKFIPYLTFAQRRIERDEIVLPAHVYADRKREMTKRVETMINYLQTDICRSRFLLNYFGETADHDCGLCDNCTASSPLPTMDEAYVRSRILEFINKQHPKSLLDIQLPDIPKALLGKVLHQMLEQEEFKLSDDRSS